MKFDKSLRIHRKSSDIWTNYEFFKKKFDFQIKFIFLLDYLLYYRYTIVYKIHGQEVYDKRR